MSDAILSQEDRLQVEMFVSANASGRFSKWPLLQVAVGRVLAQNAEQAKLIAELERSIGRKNQASEVMANLTDRVQDERDAAMERIRVLEAEAQCEVNGEDNRLTILRSFLGQIDMHSSAEGIQLLMGRADRAEALFGAAALGKSAAEKRLSVVCAERDALRILLRQIKEVLPTGRAIWLADTLNNSTLYASAGSVTDLSLRKYAALLEAEPSQEGKP